MHNLRTVYKFEVIRTLKKKSFWIMAFSFPLMIGVIIGIVYLSNKTTDENIEKMKEEKYSVLITDESGVIKPALSSAFGAETVQSKQAGIDKVKSGEKDAYFYFPADLSTAEVEVYGKDSGLFENSKYESVAKYLLAESASGNADKNTTAILSQKVQFSSTAYKDGEVYEGFKQMIAPGIFLVLFYFLIAMFGNQMLTSTVEEKENRVIEMILTTVKAKTLIVGKILALITLAFLQGILVIAPALIAYFIFKDSLSLPAIDLSGIPFDWYRITAAIVIFISSFLFFTGLLVAIGAASPTAKEAGGFIGVVMMLLFGPLYAASLFISSPESPFVQFMTLFPLTAPIPALLRNAVGNLSQVETILVIVILAISAYVTMIIAVRMFKYGAIEYSKKISLRAVLKK